MLTIVTGPLKDITSAVVLPVKAIFVIGLPGFINWMTYSGTWWFKWVAFGMGIAVLLSFARAAKTLLVLALVAWGGRAIYRRYGADARQHFDDWVAEAKPQAAQVLAALRRPAGESARAL